MNNNTNNTATTSPIPQNFQKFCAFVFVAKTIFSLVMGIVLIVLLITLLPRLNPIEFAQTITEQSDVVNERIEAFDDAFTTPGHDDAFTSTIDSIKKTEEDIASKQEEMSQRVEEFEQAYNSVYAQIHSQP